MSTENIVTEQFFVTPSQDAPLSAQQRTRYARHLTLAGLGEEGQRKLLDARVLVVGAGGLGSPVLAYLAAAGVGVLGVVDDDMVEVSNLQRQVIHSMDDVGRPKAQSAAEFVHRLNPDVVVEQAFMRVGADPEALVERVAAYDLVIDGTDNFETRYALNDACVLLEVPFVWASISQFEGQLGVYLPDAGPCYRCLFPQAPPAGSVPNCAVGGVLGVLPGVMGGLEATEAIKVMCEVGKVDANSVLLYDALTSNFDRLPLVRDPACATCGAEVTVPPSLLQSAPTWEEVSARLAAPNLSEATLVDVREPAEIEVLPIVGAGKGVALSPFSAFDEPMARRWADIAREEPVYFVCASGVRSARAAEMVADVLVEGQVYSIRGGAEALNEALSDDS